MKKCDTAVKAEGLSSAEVAIRWVAHHSALTEDDAMILGASRVEQTQESVGFSCEGKLPEDVLSLADELWEAVRESRGSIC